MDATEVHAEQAVNRTDHGEVIVFHGLCRVHRPLARSGAMSFIVIPFREDNRGFTGTKKNPAETALQYATASDASAGFLLALMIRRLQLQLQNFG